MGGRASKSRGTAEAAAPKASSSSTAAAHKRAFAEKTLQLDLAGDAALTALPAWALDLALLSLDVSRTGVADPLGVLAAAAGGGRGGASGGASGGSGGSGGGAGAGGAGATPPAGAGGAGATPSAAGGAGASPPPAAGARGAALRSRLRRLVADGCARLGAARGLDGVAACARLTELSACACGLAAPLPALPPALARLALARNPRLGPAFPLRAPAARALAATLAHLDLSGCGVAALPPALALLASLRELVLDDNRLETLELLPGAANAYDEGAPGPGGGGGWGALASLRSLSAARNDLAPLPGVLPPALLRDTPLHALALQGNARLSLRWLLAQEGVDALQARRAATRDKGLAGDVYAMQAGSFCGLEG